MTTLPTLSALPDETNAGRIVAQLRDDIAVRASKPDDPAQKGEIALRAGVSRQPVREALIRPAQMGVVHLQTRESTRAEAVLRKHLSRIEDI